MNARMEALYKVNPSHKDYKEIVKTTQPIYVVQAQTICDHDKLLGEDPKCTILRCAMTACDFSTAYEPHMAYCMGILSRHADAKVFQQLSMIFVCILF